MSKDPAVLFYTSDFLTGTMTMSHESVGKYIRLLCLQHQKGRLQEQDMLYICGTYVKEIFEKFIKDEDGLYYNERLENETLRRRKYSESRKNNISKRYEPTYVVHMETATETINIKEDSNKKKEILTYFSNKGYPAEEAESFFNHYESQGWFTGSGMKITNWRLKAENWHKGQKERTPYAKPEPPKKEFKPSSTMEEILKKTREENGKT